MADRQNILLQIEGMTCDGCSSHVRRALADANVSDDRIVKAVEHAGYRVIICERHALAPAPGRHRVTTL